jgi:hypothetical protein
VALPFASALVAVRVAPAAQVEVAGEQVAVKPVLGQDTSRLQNGALVRRDHGHLPLLGTDVGVDIDADWNRLIPSNERSRRYLVALWDDPRPELRRLQDAARDYLVRWGLIGFATGVGVGATALLSLRVRRRRLSHYTPEQARLVSEHNRRLRRTVATLAVAGLVAVDAWGIALYADRDHEAVVPDPEFAGTTLAGTEANGLISDILPFLSILEPRSDFYDVVSHGLTKALAERPDLHSQSGRVVFVLAEDFEDVNGMARQVGRAAAVVDADFLALSGDLTFAGKPVESYIIDTIDYYSDERPVYFAPGLHDTDAIVQAAQARGWHVGDGTTHTIGDLTLLAAADPRISNVGDFGSGEVLRNPDVDLETFVQNTTDETCRSRPDFVLLHDHVLGSRIAASDCQRRAVLDGRSFEFLGPQRVPTTDGHRALEYTSGSAGGHVTTTPDPGEIRAPARFSILTCDADGRHARYAVVTVRPDASVTVTPSIDLRVPYADFLANGTLDPSGSGSGKG